ncbi:gas vesicle accessory protein GvpU [Bacillus daqingensis]|uniref:Gas vesicle accessory protein GvpU n=1 Tax=Bacillus daqingensis TaxID=872396 RepID=A0ABV9NP24_9BACI
MPGIKNEKDVILQMMIEACNDNEDYTLPVTVNVNGSIISGDLIGAERYFTEFKEAFDTDLDADKGIYESLEKAAEKLSSGEEPEINYIHIADAKLFDESGTALPSKGAVLWRGKLKEVDGFFLGKVKESS